LKYPINQVFIVNIQITSVITVSYGRKKRRGERENENNA
jgi:hypothetical protein